MKDNGELSSPKRLNVRVVQWYVLADGRELLLLVFNPTRVQVIPIIFPFSQPSLISSTGIFSKKISFFDYLFGVGSIGTTT